MCKQITRLARGAKCEGRGANGSDETAWDSSANNDPNANEPTPAPTF